MPRPALMLFAHLTSALYLLEQAVWSYNQAQNASRHSSHHINPVHYAHEHEVDIEVFVRWVEEFGLGKALRDVEAVWEFGTGEERYRMDTAVVYGSEQTVEGNGKARL